MTPGSPGFVGAPALGGAPPAGLPASATPSLTHVLLSHQRASSSLSPSLGQNGDAKGVERSGWHGGKPGILPGGSGCSESLLNQPSVPWLPRRPRHHPTSFSLRDVQERIYFCCFQSPRLWGFVQAARDTSTVRLPAVGPSPASSLSSPIRLTSLGLWSPSSPGDGQRLWLGLGLSPASRAFQPLDYKPGRGGWGTCIPTQSPRLRPHCLVFPDDVGIQVGTAPQGCEAGVRVQRGSPAGLR